MKLVMKELGLAVLYVAAGVGILNYLIRLLQYVTSY